jgi:Spy/CpxP family protein refolding chaperone
MKLTPSQQAKVKKILADYKREVNGILKTHRQKVAKLIEDTDKKKMEQLRRLIGS